MRTATEALRRWYAGAAALARLHFAAPTKLTVSQWADRYRVLTAEEGAAEPGRWYTSRQPYQRAMMDACCDPAVPAVVFITSAQVGKTDIEVNLIGFHIDQDPAPIAFVMPSDKFAKAFSVERLAPMLRACPRLRRKVRESKRRESDNAMQRKLFPGGNLNILGANSVVELAGRPKRILIADEYAKWKASAGVSGDPLWQLYARATTHWNRKLIISTTPETRGEDPSESWWEKSTQERYHVPCPHCGHLHVLQFPNLRWQDNDPKTAAFACPACGCVIEEHQRHAMVAGGIWIPAHPGRAVRGFHIWAAYSAFVRWSEIVEQWLESEGNPEKRKAFTMLVLGEWWVDTVEQLDPTSLESHRHAYPKQDGALVVPAKAGLLTAAVDVQDDRLEFLVVGWGAGYESWRIHHEILYGDPGQPALWRELDALLLQHWRHESGAQLRLSAVAIDSGGHHSGAVYTFCSRRAGRRIYATKGASVAGRPLLNRPTRSNKAKVLLYTIGTEAAKDWIFSNLKLTTAGPGYMHYPEEPWCDAEFFAQTASERPEWVKVKGTGRKVRRYVKTRERNEILDLEVGNLSALHMLGSVTVRSLAKRVRRLNGGAPVAPDAAAEAEVPEDAAEDVNEPDLRRELLAEARAAAAEDGASDFARRERKRRMQKAHRLKRGRG